MSGGNLDDSITIAVVAAIMYHHFLTVAVIVCGTGNIREGSFATSRSVLRLYLVYLYATEDTMYIQLVSTWFLGVRAH